MSRRSALHIEQASATELFKGTADAPRQVVRIRIAGAPPHEAVELSGLARGSSHADADGVAELEATMDPGLAPPGATIRGELTARCADRSDAAGVEVVVAEPGWTMHMVSHFHYDPVWWNTQAAFTAQWDLPAQPGGRWRSRGQLPVFELLDLHLQLARRDPDYTFVLAEVDYLKPYWDKSPEQRSLLRDLIAAGRVELVGGTYNEPSTTLTSSELTVRNLVYGAAYQRGVLGGDPTAAWQLDVFGHAPQFPGLAADAGLRYSSWARGPFHEWGPMSAFSGRPQLANAKATQFPSEFDWISPSGRGVLTSYMVAHYCAGWWTDEASTLEQAERELYELFTHLKPTATTPNVLLPVGMDHVRPNRWLPEVHRHWNETYVWPRFVCSLPREFFAAVERDLGRHGTPISAQTRDMNPIFTGKDVSYIDTKQANRAAENLLADAEKFATLAALLGLGAYPHAALDKAWRQLVYSTHHDSITGTESDQVYLDLLSSWRDAWSLAAEVYRSSTRALATAVPRDGDGACVTAFNALSFERSDLVVADVPGRPTAVRDSTGEARPALAEGSDEHGWRVTFLAGDVPPTGYRSYNLSLGGPASDPLVDGWRRLDATGIENSFYRLEVDPERGGTVVSLVERSTGRELITPGEAGNELLVYQEYSANPEDDNLGPWLLLPKGGPHLRSSTVACDVETRRCPIGAQISVAGELGAFRFVQTLSLWHDVPRLECVTKVVAFDGQDELLRVRWPCDVPGALPVAEVGNAVVGRSFAFPNADAATHPRTLDNAAHQWFALSHTAGVRVTDPETGAVRRLAMGVAEIVSGDAQTGADAGRQLAIALVRAGVTATSSVAASARYGDLAVDSNLPDVRIALGGPDDNGFVAELLETAGAGYAAELERQLAQRPFALVLVPGERGTRGAFSPGGTVTGVRALPTLVVAGDLGNAVAHLADDLTDNWAQIDQCIGVDGPDEFVPATVGVMNRGTPGFAVDTDGALYVSLMRSCTGWPSGTWINPPARTTPDGTGFQLQHWTHEFEYALASGPGDWRQTGLVAAGHGYNHPLGAVTQAGHVRSADGSASLLAVEPADSVFVTTLKAAHDPLAEGRRPQAFDGAMCVRLYEAHGAGTTVRVRSPFGYTAAGRATILEEDSTSPVLAGTEIATAVAPADTATYLVRAEPADGGGTPALGPAHERGGPVFSPYWLHNTGPAPMGNHPVAVHLRDRVTMTDGRARVGVTVASSVPDESVRGELTVRFGDDGPAERVPVLLQPNGWRSFDVTFPSADDAKESMLVVAELDTGVPTFDAGLYTLDTGRRMSTAQLTGLLEVGWRDARVSLREPETSTVTLIVSSRAHFRMVGAVQILSPWGTWGWLDDWHTPVTLAPGAATELSFPLTPEPGHAPCTTWMLAKAMCFGIVAYSSALAIDVQP